MKYILEIYEDSFSYEASYAISSDTSFPALSIGHRYDQMINSGANWASRLSDSEEYRIKDVVHTFVDMNGVAVHCITKVLLEVSKVS